MKFTGIAAVAAFGVALSGCATIIDGTTQSVSVNTKPEEGAGCTLTNSQGTWYLTSPGSTIVHRTKTDLDVTCTKAGYKPGHVVAVSHFTGKTAANLLLSPGPGLVIDAASGANYKYDNPINVPLGERETGQVPAAAPSIADSSKPTS